MANAAVSNTAVRKDLWVQLPPAAPFERDLWPTCRASPPDPTACVDDRGLGSDYAYLLGLYLGDGTVSRCPRDVWRLRIFMDSQYDMIVAACKAAMAEVVGRPVGHRPYTNERCVEIYSFWKHWVCLFPQTGGGRKHLRKMQLEEWQSRLVQRHPEELVRGLIHSDGCRVINRIRIRGRTYEYPRYFFSNRSDEIRAIFVAACELLGVESRPNNR